MPDEQKMLSAPQKYLDALSAGDLDAVVALYADDAVVEDPVGSEKRIGKDAIREFYQVAVDSGMKGSLSGEPRLAAQEVAFPFVVRIEAANIEMRIIDVFRFNEDAEIVEMRAFWGAGNSHQTNAAD